MPGSLVDRREGRFPRLRRRLPAVFLIALAMALAVLGTPAFGTPTGAHPAVRASVAPDASLPCDIYAAGGHTMCHGTCHDQGAVRRVQRTALPDPAELRPHIP